MNEHLQATLGLDNGPFVRGIRGAKGVAQDFQASLQRLGQIMGAGLFAGLIKKSIDFAATIKDVSDTTGIATGTLQTFRVKASEAAGSVDIADKALEKFTVTIGEALSGSETAQNAFKQIGVSLTDAGGKAKSNQQLFEDVSDALGNITDPAERARAAVDLFGKSGVKLATSFEGGNRALREMQAELIRTGQILGDEAIAKLDDYDARIKRLQNSLQNAGAKTAAFVGGLVEKIGAFYGAMSTKQPTLNPAKYFENVADALKAAQELDEENIRLAKLKLKFDQQMADNERQILYQKEQALALTESQRKEEERLLALVLARSRAEADAINARNAKMAEATTFKDTKEMAALAPENQFKAAQEAAAQNPQGPEAAAFKKLNIDPNDPKAMEKAYHGLRNNAANGDPNAVKDRTTLFGRPLSPDLKAQVQQAQEVERLKAQAEQMRGFNPKGAEAAINQAEQIKAGMPSLSPADKTLGPKSQIQTMQEAMTNTGGLSGGIGDAIRQGWGMLTPEQQQAAGHRSVQGISGLQGIGVPRGQADALTQLKENLAVMAKKLEEIQKQQSKGIVVYPKNAP